MREQEAGGNELLIYVGVGIYALAIVLQMLSFWFNAYLFGWMSLKYLALLALGLLPIAMFEGRSRVAKALGVFFSVLALSGTLTYSEGSIDAMVGAKKRAAEARLEEATQGWEAHDTRAWRNFRYYDELLTGLQNEFSAAKNAMLAKAGDDKLQAERDTKEWTNKLQELKTERDEKDKAYKAELKERQNLDAAEEIARLRHELEFDHAASDLADRRSDLYAAKALDFFVLFGAALFIIGCLLPGESAVPPYSPPAPPAKPPQ